MWIVVLAWLGCDRGSPVRPTSEASVEAPVRPAATGPRLDCADNPECTAAEARLRAIDIVLRRDCGMGGAVDPEKCEAEQARLRQERTDLLSRFGGSGTRSVGAEGPGGGGEGENMEIDVNDE